MDWAKGVINLRGLSAERSGSYDDVWIVRGQVPVAEPTPMCIDRARVKGTHFGAWQT